MIKIRQLLFMNKHISKKDRFIIWLMYMLRHLADILTGIVGILSLSFIILEFPMDISENILRHAMSQYNEEDDHNVL